MAAPLKTADFASEQWWKDLLPGFPIGAGSAQPDNAIALDASLIARLQQLLDREGYLHLSGAENAQEMGELARAVSQLVANGIPPVFAFVYDRFWQPFHRLDAVIEGVLGAPYMMLPDFWAWCVEPQREEAGWRPHRDKDYRTLFPDRRPKSITVWIPISDANILNGCMYLLPADRDPTYGTAEDNKWNVELPNVRALPAQPGQALIWNQAVLHWGSRSSQRADGPRISMACEFQRADVAAFNSPLIRPAQMLTFDQRLALITKQILQYRHMYKVAPEILAFATAQRARLDGPAN